MTSHNVRAPLVLLLRPTPLVIISLAAGALALAVLLRLPFESWLAGSLPYATFFPAVLIAALFGGRWAGALVLVFGGPLALGLFGGTSASLPYASLAIWFTNGVLIYLLALAVRKLLRELRRREEELTAAQRQLESVVAELQHRAKNTFTIVLAIVHQTSRDAQTVADYRTRLTERLTALGRAHDLLTGEHWEQLDLEAVVDAALRPFRQPDHSRFELEISPVCTVTPPIAIALTLALHELATNALKYGALSNPQGVVQCGWRIEGSRVHLHWRERGGPTVAPPSRTGLGSRLIQQALAVDDASSVELRFEPEGVVCLLAFNPIAADQTPAAATLPSATVA